MYYTKENYDATLSTKERKLILTPEEIARRASKLSQQNMKSRFNHSRLTSVEVETLSNDGIGNSNHANKSRKTNKKSLAIELPYNNSST